MEVPQVVDAVAPADYLRTKEAEGISMGAALLIAYWGHQRGANKGTEGQGSLSFRAEAATELRVRLIH